MGIYPMTNKPNNNNIRGKMCLQLKTTVFFTIDKNLIEWWIVQPHI